MVPKMFEPLKFDFTSVISYVAFVLSLFGPHLSFFWCIGGRGVGGWGGGGLCFVIVIFLGYLYLYFNIVPNNVIAEGI